MKGRTRLYRVVSGWRRRRGWVLARSVEQAVRVAKETGLHRTGAWVDVEVADKKKQRDVSNFAGAVGRVFFPWSLVGDWVPLIIVKSRDELMV